MADTTLTQQEADALLAIEKHWDGDEQILFPVVGGKLTAALHSPDERERFVLVMTRGYIDIAKASYTNRGRQTIMLARVDISGPNHRNPDGEEIPCPHLHVYREGYGDRWAQPLPSDGFEDAADLWQTLVDFMQYCNVTLPPIIDRGLFT